MAVEPHQLDFSPTSDRSNQSDDEQELKYTSTNGTAAVTTFYAEESNNPDKWGRYWARNAGVDDHRADGRSTGDVHKVNENERDRRRVAEQRAQLAELDSGRVEEASDLAAKLDARAFGYHGGTEAVAFGVAQYVAAFDVYDTIDAFAEEADGRLTNGEASLRWAVEKIAEIQED